MASKCDRCLKQLTKHDDYIRCSKSLCGKSYHIICAGLTMDSFLDLNRSDRVLTWNCRDCLTKHPKKAGSDDGSDDTSNNDSKCQYCKKVLRNANNCNNCSAKLHPSCIKQHLKKCPRTTDDEVDFAAEDVSLLSPMEHLKREVALLNLIIKEKDDSNSLLRKLIDEKDEVIRLLKSTNDLSKTNNCSEDSLQQVRISATNKPADKRTVSTPSATTDPPMNTQKRQPVQQAASVSSVVEPIEKSSNGFTTQRKRHRVGSKKITTGIAPATATLKAHATKNWACVKRVAKHVTADSIREHILTTNADFHDSISVKELAFQGKSKAFQIGFDPKLEHIIYSPNLWPSGILVEEYNFQQKENFQRTNQNTNKK